MISYVWSEFSPQLILFWCERLCYCVYNCECVCVLCVSRAHMIDRSGKLTHSPTSGCVYVFVALCSIFAAIHAMSSPPSLSQLKESGRAFQHKTQHNTLDTHTNIHTHKNTYTYTHRDIHHSGKNPLNAQPPTTTSSSTLPGRRIRAAPTPPPAPSSSFSKQYEWQRSSITNFNRIRFEELDRRPRRHISAD